MEQQKRKGNVKMTEAQISEAYAGWLPKSAHGREKSLLSGSDVLTVNFDLSEDEKNLMSRIYYLVPHFIDGRFMCFVFYRENTFEKTENGDLKLINWEYGIEDSPLCGGAWNGNPSPAL